MSKKWETGGKRLRRGWLCGASALALGAAMAVPAGEAGAVEFTVGELKGSFDTTLSVGALFRIQDQDPDLIGSTNGGRGFSSNVDDGNRNYDPGLTSLLGRATHELKLDYQNYGAFVRATYFYDWVNAQRSSTRGSRTDVVPLSEEAVDAVGRDLDLLDAYVFGSWDVAERPLTLRLGNQVINWGESTFIPGGLSAINPVDVAALRAPGSEIRDALRPVPMFSASLGVTEDLSVEGFYQFVWQKTELEPRGTLFSTNDFAVDGGQFVNLGFGTREGVDAAAATAQFGSRVPRGRDREADDQGQFGVGLRYFAQELGETEFGAYFANLHSRVPLISAVSGVATTTPFASGARYIVEYPEDIKVIGGSFNTNFAGITFQGEYTFRKDQPLQLDDVELLQAATAPAAVAGAAAQGAAAGRTTALNAVARQVTGNPAATFAGLPPATQSALLAQPTVQAAAAQGSTLGAAQGGTLAADRFNTNQIIRDLGGIDRNNAVASASRLFGQEISGYRLHDVSQAQIGATKVFAPALGADQWLLVGEVGAIYVHGMPDASVMRYDGPGTFRGGNPSLAGFEGVQGGGFADQFSWGYRLRARFDYLNAIGSVNLYPILSWAHDVGGTTPLPLGTFLEDRKAISIGLQATYLDRWTGEVQLTSFFGREDFNLLHDRDFLSFNVKYSF